MQIKTVSFLSGKILIGKVSEAGDWKSALFVSIVRQPETGERTAFFKPAVPGRLSQDMDREEFLKLIQGAGGYVGPSDAAPGLAKAYENFLDDEEAIHRCVNASTTECGPSAAFLGKIPDSECKCAPLVDGNIISATFRSSQKKIYKLEDIE